MSTITRYNMFFEGIYLFTYKPIFGWGMNGFRLYGAYHTYSHSAISETLCNYGIVGFTCFFAPIIMSLMSKKNSDWNDIKIMLIIFMISTSIFAMSCNSKVYYIILAILCACSNMCTEQDNKKIALL